MRRLLPILILCSALAFGSPKGSHHSTKASTADHPKPVHVNGYNKKNGTHVDGYQRGLPGSANSKKKHKK